MTHTLRTLRLWKAPVLALLVSRCLGSGSELSVVTIEGGRPIALESRQALWKSPYGGWVVVGWPYAMALDQKPVLAYQSAQERLSTTLDPTTKKAVNADDLLNEIKGQPKQPGLEDGGRSSASRRSLTAVDLEAGRHVLQPFVIEITAGPGNALTSNDSRVRVDAKTGRIELVCHPVTIKHWANNRSTYGPIRLNCGNTPLLAGLEKQIADFEKENAGTLGGADGNGIRRLTIYLPASTPDNAYEVNGVRFEVDGDGKVRLAKSDQARSSDGEIHLLAPRPEDVARPVGVSWFGAGSKVAMSSGAKTVEVSGSGSAWVPVGVDRKIQLDKAPVRLPASDARWPHEFVIWDAAASAAWSVSTAPLSATPSGDWSCRIASLTEATPAAPATLAVQLVAEPSGDVGGEMVLKAGGGEVLAGKLPAKPGLWRLVVAANSPWAGRTLGMVHIAPKPVAASVSLYTDRNRGIVRRGDRVSLLWSVKRPAGGPAVEWPVLLRGGNFSAAVGKIVLPPRAGDVVAGSLSLDTTALAPGDYMATVVTNDVLTYPVRLRICQREPVSDFELYTYVYGDAKPYAGSPVTGYYGGIPSGPGLAPFLADGDVAMDPLLAAYSDSPAGPALEKFGRPTPNELSFMALARLGMRAVPNVPDMLHHEEWNPKHTLPDELSQLRRRFALFAQPKADVAGFGGLALGWYATVGGYWEESPPLDGHQKQRNAAADKWVAARVAAELAPLAGKNLTSEQVKRQESWAGVRARSSILPTAFGEYLADVRQMAPGLTAHNAIPSFWQGKGQSYPPTAYATLTHRDAVDYTDYCLPPWGNFRAPAFMAMGNPQRQKLQCEFFTHNSRSEQLATAFGAAGRGLDGFSMTGASDGLLRIFQRYGGWFSAYEPLPDVAVFFSGWAEQASVILHDLARMRRPGMLVSPEDVLAGDLNRYQVLLLASTGDNESPEILKAFRDFAERGGVVIKDANCHASLPGRSLSFAYDKEQVHNGWGLAYPNGEWEFAHLWKNFRQTREQSLIKAFAETPRIPVTTPNADVVISPLAGKESLLCFVINQTLVPLEVEGRWRQMFVLPRVGELKIEPGWHVRDVLAGTVAAAKSTPDGLTVPVDFTRAEGALFLLTRREPKTMSVRTTRTAATNLRLNAWLADAKHERLPDPMPFEVTLSATDGQELFHKFAALAPGLSLDIPVPAQASDAPLKLTVRDLILGSVATQAVAPATPAAVASHGDADFVGGVEPIAAFLSNRKGPVTVLLDEGQDAFRPAAEKLATILNAAGRQARVVVFRPDEVRPLPLRWKPLPEDVELVDRLRDGNSFVSRVALNAVTKVDTKSGNKSHVVFEDPKCGYDEYGPRLRHDSDVVMFGSPASHRALAELAPYLRRAASESRPASGGYFVHYLWSPFQGGFDGIYVGCHDAAGATAAVERLAALRANGGTAPKPVRAEDALAGAGSPPSETHGGAPEPLENLIVGNFGSAILNVSFVPDGTRLYVTTAAMGDSLFAVSPTGEIQEHSSRYFGRNNFWAPYDGSLEAVDQQTVKVGVGGTLYRYRFDQGWVSRIPAPRHGLAGRFSIPIGASTVLKDANQQTFLGGARTLHALDAQGRLRWSYDDTTVRNSAEDLIYPRSLFPRGITSDGRVLLVAAFGIKHDVYSRGTAVNTSVFGLDVATGKLLWQRPGWLLNQGKVIATTDRFLVVDDEGATQLIHAARGETLSRMQSVAGAEWVLPIAASESLLIVENQAFDRQGPASRVYLRPLNGSPDKLLPVSGRVTDVVVAPDGHTITCVTARGLTERFSVGGRLLWQTATPPGGIVRLSPDGKTVFVGARDGRLHWLDAADGKLVRSVDFNPFNVTTPEQFVRQLDSVGNLPLDPSMSAPPPIPEPSYRTTHDGKAVKFGPNLVTAAQLSRVTRAAAANPGDPASASTVEKTGPDASLTLQLEAGRTYLVELLAAAAEPDKLTAHTRLEISVVGNRPTGNLPYTARLPVTRYLTRRRAAFRADETGTVTVTLRTVEPRPTADAKKTALTFDQAKPADAGLLVADLLVAAMNFGGRNLVYDSLAKAASEKQAPKSPSLGLDAGPNPGSASKGRPAGDLNCLVMPWTGGNSTVRHEPYPCPLAAFRLVDGVIANQETAWTTEARGTGIDRAECRVRFKTPQKVGSIVLYEDNSGPVPDAQGVRERNAQRFAVYVRESATKQLRPIGVITDNQQLVHILACPPVAIDEIQYLWAGRNDSDKTDGLVRLAELEAYSTDDPIGDILDDVADSPLNNKPRTPGKKK